jgi:hypothetical protein
MGRRCRVSNGGYRICRCARDAGCRDPRTNRFGVSENLAGGPDEKPQARERLLNSSDIISFGGLATLVPKHAILQVPASCTGRMNIEPGAKIVSWADFYAANRSWITTVEIGIVQAEGKQPIAEETKKMMSKSRNLIVATYQGGPISLLPPPKAAPKATDKPAATPAATTPATKPSTTQS